MNRYGRVMLTGPSGVGKSTLARALVQRKGYVPLRSHTTRPRREGEPEDAYYFVSMETFRATPMVEQMTYHGNAYGLSLASLEAASNCGAQPIVHTASCDTFTAYHPLGFRSILLLAPSEEALRQRLVDRDGHEGRVEISISEHASTPILKPTAHAYVVNDDLQAAVEAVLKIVRTWGAASQ